MLGAFQCLPKQQEYRPNLRKFAPIHGYTFSAEGHIIATDARELLDAAFFIDVNEERTIFGRKRFYHSLEKLWIPVCKNQVSDFHLFFFGAGQFVKLIPLRFSQG
jgi:hypothetical protein